MILNEDSLNQTLDNLNEAFFYERAIPDDEKHKVARWIATRQGLKGAYASMFAPTERDYEERLRVFTGEGGQSIAITGHVLSEEACRALILLNVGDYEVDEALNRATEGIARRMKSNEEEGLRTGFYCCGTCTTSLLRHLSAGGLSQIDYWLEDGLKIIKEHRDGEGRWGRFPFYYTLLALSEINIRWQLRR